MRLFICWKCTIINYNQREIVKFDKIEHDLQVRECYEKLKNTIEYVVYKHLKDKKFYVTSGLKYGADFLLYRDDPNFIHSEWLVYTKEYKSDISLKEIINGERISMSHKKKFLVASVDEKNQVVFYNMQWLNI
jgi:tRNA-intron lyase